MEENKKFKLVASKKTRYLLPNILTLGGVCLGISSIKFSIDGNFSLAVTLILFAAILDALDGRIARLIKGTSEFGKELDSLTDFVSFGIAPVFVLYFWDLNKYGKLGWAITLVYSVCCVLRLARFNLTKVEETQKWKNNFFEGIPSPAGGLLILMPLIYELTNLNFGYDIKNLTPLFNSNSSFTFSKQSTDISIKKNFNFAENYCFFIVSYWNYFYCTIVLYFRVSFGFWSCLSTINSSKHTYLQKS